MTDREKGRQAVSTPSRSSPVSLKWWPSIATASDYEPNIYLTTRSHRPFRSGPLRWRALHR